LYGRNLQYIRVTEDRAVLKRGASELLLRGEGVHTLLEPLIEMLDGRYSRKQVLESFPEEQREEIDGLLTGLLLRRLISEEPEPAGEVDLNSLQASFWSTFGEAAREAPERLRKAKFVVVGANLITRTLIRSLLEMGAGQVTLVDHAVLNSEIVTHSLDSGERLKRVPEIPSEKELAEASLLCAASDFGQPDALLEINRVALRIQRPFLPVWLEDLLGYVGPLTYPYESACLRCYRLRIDSNVADHLATRAIRQHMSQNPQARSAAGLLPPMAGILGEIAATEMAKFIGGFPPTDTVGRVIEMNLVSFGSSVRRVLKIPRCPDCGEVMKHATKALTTGPLIPYSE
jgi:bacteriocin biosynthesis cyclodehydratase domain-containing protein